MPPKTVRNSNATAGKPRKSNQLRIIGGKWKGRKLAIAEVDGLRPTGDRIRETLFNWLMADIPGADCLDTFSGSGALGLEALSRGASSATLIELNPLAARQLTAHLEQLQCQNGNLLKTDALAYLQQPASQQFGVVFLDPPFQLELWQPVIQALDAGNWLKEDAWIYVESPRRQALHTPSHWSLYREKTAGDVSYRLFQASALTL